MKNFNQKLILFFATGGGVGLIPGAPGTYGTVVGFFLYWAVIGLSPLHYLLFVLTFSIFSAWAAGFAELSFGQKDSGKIVIDEIAGYLVTMLFVPAHFSTMVVGFIFFRLFDIWKPFPIRKIERHVKGGWGVVGDDLAAGVFANLVLQLLVRFL